jgi:hypothetical protein
MVDMVLDAWTDLDRSRPLGERFTGQIPYEAIVAFAQVEELDYDDFALLKDTLRILDGERLDRIHQKLKKNAKGSR